VPHLEDAGTPECCVAGWSVPSIDVTQPAPSRPRRRRWRRVVAWTAVVTTTVIDALGTVGAVLFARADMSNVGQGSFANALRIPELDTGVRGPDGVLRFDLDVQSGATAIKPGSETATWGVNGTYLGPTLRVNRGDPVEVAVTNGVEETTSMHWHGMHLPARMDGGPHQPIEPGETWRPAWTVDQPAATLWYHPHPHGTTADHVARGVAGMVIVDDTATSTMDLPDTYGVDDVPVIIQDRNFDGDNQFDLSDRFLANVGMLGDEILVNGTHDPHLDVITERVRLRLLNASNARSYDLGFVDGRTFQLIGTDGGLLPTPIEHTRVPLSPGERAEIVVALTAGEDVVLHSFPRRGGGSFFTERFAGRDDSFDILQLRATDTLAPSPAVPERLVEFDRLDPSDATRSRTFGLSGTNINGLDMDMNRIDATITAGTTEIWDVTNVDGQAHAFHVHDVQFQVLDVDGDAPPEHLSGWKDTVEIPASSTVRLIIPFGTHSDPASPYMFHCHILRHEDRGMMGQFVVVEPGQPAETVDHSDH